MAKPNPALPRYSPRSNPRLDLIPNRIKELRERGKDNGGIWLSQREVGNALGFNGSTVSRHESGKTPLTDAEVEQYALLLKVTREEIFAPKGQAAPKAVTAPIAPASQPEAEEDDLTALAGKYLR